MEAARRPGKRRKPQSASADQASGWGPVSPCTPVARIVPGRPPSLAVEQRRPSPSARSSSTPRNPPRRDGRRQPHAAGARQDLVLAGVAALIVTSSSLWSRPCWPDLAVGQAEQLPEAVSGVASVRAGSVTAAWPNLRPPERLGPHRT